jgi:hypothetical protein
MLEQAATCPAAICSKRWQHVWLQHGQKGGKHVRQQHAQKSGNMSSYTILAQEATCSKRRQHVWLQHARKGSNMSSYNMLEQSATCPATTCSNRLQHHAVFVTTSHFYGLLDIIIVMDCCTADKACRQQC